MQAGLEFYVGLATGIIWHTLLTYLCSYVVKALQLGESLSLHFLTRRLKVSLLFFLTLLGQDLKVLSPFFMENSKGNRAILG